MAKRFGDGDHVVYDSEESAGRRVAEASGDAPDPNSRRPSAGLIPISNLLNPPDSEQGGAMALADDRSRFLSDARSGTPASQTAGDVSPSSLPGGPLPIRLHDQQMESRQTISRERVRFGGIQDLINTDNMAGIVDDTVRFSLRVAQQPVAARACGQADADRRVVDPPPIVQLLVEAPTLPENVLHDYLRYDYQMLAELFDETGTVDASTTMMRSRRGSNLIGETAINSVTITSPPAHLECFFGFFDLSVRLKGKYRLQFSLLMVDHERAKHQRFLPFTSRVMSEPFVVQSPSEFRGMRPSSELSLRLIEAGARGTVRSGKGKRKTRDDGGDDDPNDDDGNDVEDGPGDEQNQHRFRTNIDQ